MYEREDKKKHVVELENITLRIGHVSKYELIILQIIPA